MNDFYKDDDFQRHKRDTILIPRFYKTYFSTTFYLCDADRDLQSRGIDTVIRTMKCTVNVEEKIVRKQHSAFALETRSCTVEGHEKTGWMFYGEADRLLYCFSIANEELDCWWMDFPALQKWFWTVEQTFPTFQMSQNNRTSGRVVAIDRIKSAGIFVVNFRL